VIKAYLIVTTALTVQTREPPGPAVRWVEVAPAESLRVETSGAGPTVVLLPGLFGSSYSFRRVVPLLVEAGHRVLVIEPLGVGSSGRPGRSDYSLAAQAARVAVVLDSLRAAPVVLVAHAVGASVALRLAVQRPDLVAALVSLDGGAAESATTPGFRRAMSLAPWIRLVGGMRIVRGRIRSQLVSSSSDPSWVTDEVIAGYTAGAAADLGATLQAYQRMAESREPAPLAPRLASIRCPVKLLLGATPHSSSVPEGQVELLRARIAGFTADSLEGVGHFAHEERPVAVVEAVLAVRAQAAALAASSR
jgi:magnesium chelatase accessory protein